MSTPSGLVTLGSALRLKFDRIGIMLHGAQPHRGEARWADDAFHVDMEYEYASAHGPKVYGRAPATRGTGVEVWALAIALGDCVLPR